jgi:hypothetical protein
MAAIMTLQGPPAPMLMGFGDVPYTGFGPLDALLNNPVALVLGIAAGAYVATAAGQRRFGPQLKKIGLADARHHRRRR